MKYDTAFWEKVLSEYENGDDYLICNCSYSFKNSWSESDGFQINLQSIAENWPDKPTSLRLGSCGCLFYSFNFSVKQERQTRIDFLNYLIDNKIEFEL